MIRTEQSATHTGHEQDRASTAPADALRSEHLKLEDMALAFGARIPASVIPFPIEHRAAYRLHPFS